MSNRNVIRKRLRDTERENCCGTCTLTYDTTANTSFAGVIKKVVYPLQALIRIDEEGTMYYWNLSQDGSGIMYTSGSLLLMDKNITLYGGNSLRTISYYFGTTLLRKIDYFVDAVAYIVEPPTTGSYKWIVDLNDVNSTAYNAQDAVAMNTNLTLYVTSFYSGVNIERFRVIYKTNNPNAYGEEIDENRYFIGERFTTRNGSNIFTFDAVFIGWVDVTGLLFFLPNTSYPMTPNIATYGLFARYNFFDPFPDY
jgi:hypothetical protein